MADKTIVKEYKTVDGQDYRIDLDWYGDRKRFSLSVTPVTRKADGGETCCLTDIMSESVMRADRYSKARAEEAEKLAREKIDGMIQKHQAKAKAVV